MTSSQRKPLKIVISGAGVAGLTTAYFLLRAGHHVTIIESASRLRASGQSVDVRGHALTILKRMRREAGANQGFDVFAAVQEKVSDEKGLRFVNEHNVTTAEFPVGDGTSFTGEIEIMRGDLANILYQAVSEQAKYLSGGSLNTVFGQRIVSVTTGSTRMSSNRLDIRTDDNTIIDSIDLLIVADGIGSSTRKLLWPPAALQDAIKSLNSWTCWFSISPASSDTDWARWYNAPRGRMVLIRPDRRNGDLTRVSLWTMTRDPGVETALTDLLVANSKSERDSMIERQKEYWTRLFADAGWETPRVLEGLQSADDFYMQRIAQVKLDAASSSWSVNGNTVLVGDAACCPSPISGMGVTMAMVSAYVLAGEINRTSKQEEVDLALALKRYEDRMRLFVKIAQKLAPGTPGAAQPEGAWGIWALHLFLGFISWTGIYKLFGASVNPPSQAMQLPDYDEID